MVLWWNHPIHHGFFLGVFNMNRGNGFVNLRLLRSWRKQELVHKLFQTSLFQNATRMLCHSLKRQGAIHTGFDLPENVTNTSIICTYVCVCVCIYTYTYPYTYTYTFTYIYIYVYIVYLYYIMIYIYIHLFCVYIYTYIIIYLYA